MHNKPHSKETKQKIKEKQQRWRQTKEYKEFVERQRERAKKSNTKFKKGHKPFTNGKNLLGIQAGEKHWKWGGGKIKAFGYILLWKPNHPNKSKRGYVMEHRLVMEEHLGRYLTSKEVVHHINQIKNDNRIENLQLMTRSEHNKLHLKLRYAKTT